MGSSNMGMIDTHSHARLGTPSPRTCLFVSYSTSLSFKVYAIYMEDVCIIYFLEDHDGHRVFAEAMTTCPAPFYGTINT